MAIAVSTRPKGTEARSTQGCCCATGTQSPRALPLDKRSQHSAHTWTRLRSLLLLAPCSSCLESLGLWKGDRTDPLRRGSGEKPVKARRPARFSSGYLIVSYLFVLCTVGLWSSCGRGSCKVRGHEPCSRTLRPAGAWSCACAQVGVGKKGGRCRWISAPYPSLGVDLAGLGCHPLRGFTFVFWTSQESNRDHLFC